MEGTFVMFFVWVFARYLSFSITTFSTQMIARKVYSDNFLSGVYRIYPVLLKDRQFFDLSINVVPLDIIKKKKLSSVIFKWFDIPRIPNLFQVSIIILPLRCADRCATYDLANFWFSYHIRIFCFCNVHLKLGK